MFLCLLNGINQQDNVKNSVRCKVLRVLHKNFPQERKATVRKAIQNVSVQIQSSSINHHWMNRERCFSEEAVSEK